MMTSRTANGANCIVGRRRGASMVELALVLPILVLLLAAVIDFGIYFAIRGALNYYVHESLDLASRLDVTVDTSATYCTTHVAECTDYRARKQRILSRAEAPMRQLWVKAFGSSGMAVFNRYTNTSDFGAPWTSSVYFMRPGESWTRLSDSSIVDHPTRSRTIGPPTGTETWQSVYRDHPVVVGAEVFYTPVFSGALFGTLVIRSRAIGYHRSKYFAQASPNDPGNPTSTPTAPPTTPTVSPTPTGTPGPTPNPTPTPINPCAFCSAGNQCCNPYYPICCHQGVGS